MTMPWRWARRLLPPTADAERGAAPLEFVMVMVILLPLVLTIFQIGLFLHVRNTLVACAHEGARVGANFNALPGEGATNAELCAAGVVSGDLVEGTTQDVQDGLVVVTIDAKMPGLGWLGILPIEATGRAVQETLD